MNRRVSRKGFAPVILQAESRLQQMALTGYYHGSQKRLVPTLQTYGVLLIIPLTPTADKQLPI